MVFIVKGNVLVGGGGVGGVGWRAIPLSRSLSNHCGLGSSSSLDVIVVGSLPSSGSFFLQVLPGFSFYLKRTFDILIRCGRCFQLAAEIAEFKMVLN